MDLLNLKSKSYLFPSIILITLITIIYSCSTSTKATKKAIGIEINQLPCQKEAKPQKDYFIAFSSAKSTNLSLAREKALTTAKERLASLINSTLKSTTDKYLNEREINQNSEFEQKFENLTREVVMQTLNNVEVICDKLTKTKNGEFNAFVTIEMKKENIIKNINHKISTTNKLKLDFDKEKYETIFNKEIGNILLD